MGRPRLRALAERLGILPGYRRSKGGAIRRSSDATRAALAGALGYDARDESAAAHSLERLRATARRGRRMRSGPLPRCAGPEEALGDRRGFGVTANLYSLRGPDGLGVGNLGDLRALVQLAASAGAAFVGISPLHATRNRGDEISPYAPTSRFFRNPIYLDVFDVPELADSAEAQALLDAPAVRDELRVLRDADRIDYARVARLQERLLRALHGAFAARHRGRDTPRGRAYADFHARRGPALLEFATFCALEAQLAGDG
ncbi:MAG: 4-alpha-glucanotransferase, partial [Deltaproteobacteria bacterium]